MMREEGAVNTDGKYAGKWFETETMKLLLDQFVADAGVDLLLHTRAIGVLRDESTQRIEAVRVFHKGGVEDISANIFIDSTGDGDIAAWAGAPFEVGRKEDNAAQPMTTCFRMADVDIENMTPRSEINSMYDEAKERGEVTNPRENVLYFHSLNPDTIHFNTTRIVGQSALDGWSLTEAELEGRRQVDDMVRFMKKHVKGYENAWLMRIAPQIGIRESRRIMGEYVLTAEDVLEARSFEDGIACGAYAIDIHNPAGTGTVIKQLEAGTWYQIPYRCLVPRDVSNLLVAGRCISSTHEAHSSLRVMPIIWGIGEAGGTAAAMAFKAGISPTEVDTSELRTALREQGAFIEDSA
jgi:hypothetical protein